MAQEIPESQVRALEELRCLHELARQILPLGTPEDVARDGLLCIAGITGVGSAALLWRNEEASAFVLAGQLGLGTGRLRQTYRLSANALAPLDGAEILTLESARRRPSARAFVRAIEPVASRLGDAWILPLQGERRPRGILLVGSSLVTRELATPVGLLQELGEVLRLGLVGCPVPSRSARAGRPPAPRAVAIAEPPRSARGVASRLAALRKRHPQTAEWIGESVATLGLLEELVSLASTDYPVLLQGETGTGKELAAQLLHRLSRRASGPFEAVDCSSIPRELIESELFGHVKGAFTGATRDFRGAFERADGGTLLLDEIGDMDLRSQTRLLRVLQEGSVRRLGADRAAPVDVRVVAASHRDLADLVRRGVFRDDLYYRIHVCLLALPPLRDRGDDPLVLFESEMRRRARELGRAARPMSSQARRRMREESLPGNVRQMQNIVRQLLVRGSEKGPVGLEELEAVLRRSSVPPPPTPIAEPLLQSTVLPTPGGPMAAAAVDAGGGPGVGDAVRKAAETRVVEDVGAWVLEKLREHRFNLKATAQHLQLLRKLGVARASVPVFDRGALDYYLCGEFYRRLVESQYEIEPTLLWLAGNNRLVPRLRRKVRAFIRPLDELRAGGGPVTKEALWRQFHRLPEAYYPDLERAAEALVSGRWGASGVDGP